MRRPHLARRSAPALAGLALLALSGCDAAAFLERDALSPGGPSADAGAGGVDDLTLNSGTLTVGDFDAPPTPANGTHPLGDDQVVLTKREELALFVTRRFDGPGLPSHFREDADSDYAIVSGTYEDDGGGRFVRGADAGQLDRDPEEELAVVGVDVATSSVRLWMVEETGPDTYEWFLLRTIASPVVCHDAQVTLGDFDGDGIDEIAVVGRNEPIGDPGVNNTSWLRVYDDPGEGMAQMMFTDRPTWLRSFWAHRADFEGDGIDELVVAMEGDSTEADRFEIQVWRGGQNAAQITLERSWTYLRPEIGTSLEGGKVVFDDFDADGADEIVYVGMFGHGTDLHSPLVRQFEYDAATGVTMVAEHSLPWSGYDSERIGFGWDIASCHRLQTPHAEIAIAFAGSDLDGYVHFLHWDADALTWEHDYESVGYVGNMRTDALDLAVGDLDADGLDEIVFSHQRHHVSFPCHVCVQHSASLRSLVLDWDGGMSTTYVSGGSGDLGGSGSPHSLEVGRPVVAPCDLDGDGYALRFTGHVELNVSDPIPLVLMSAAPTKEGISQNYDASSTSYRYGTGSTEEIGITSSSAWSATVGGSADLLPWLSVSASRTVGESMSRTETESHQFSSLRSWSGSFRDDTIVFQANLYRSHEYEIVRAPDPADVGSVVRLDVPVDHAHYKWTVDFYNSQVRTELQVGSDLLPHTIGDPSSYRTAAEMQPILDRYVSWQLQPLTVGQGISSTGDTIQLVLENTTSEQREQSVEDSIGFQIGPASASGSVSATEGSVYSITTSETTEFAFEVGDIDDPAEWLEWKYDAGIVAYQHGRLADGQNRPVGFEADGRGLTVISFYTEADGTGY